MGTIVSLASFMRNMINNFPVVLTDTERRLVVATALGRAIASQLPIPSTAVSVLHLHYSNSFERQVCNIINEFNEQMIIDTRTTRDMVFKYYMLRYDIVYPNDEMSEIIPAIAAAAPSYFPENVMSVLQKEISREDSGLYFRQWDQMVTAVSNHIIEKG